MDPQRGDNLSHFQEFLYQRDFMHALARTEANDPAARTTFDETPPVAQVA